MKAQKQQKKRQLHKNALSLFAIKHWYETL